MRAASVCLAVLFSLAMLGPARADAPVSCGRAFWTVPPVSVAPTPAMLLAQGWPEASAFTGLMDLGSREMSRSQPVFWIGHDDRSFLVGWRVPKLNGQPLAKTVSARDGALWNDDTIEIFLDPRHTHSDYLQFMVNAAGTVADARGRDLAWNGDWTARVAETDTAWAGAAIIPFATLGVAGVHTGDVWAANFGVDRSPDQRPVDWEPEAPNLTWARLGSGTSYHEPVSFGHLLFRPEVVQLTEVGQPWWRAPRFVAHTPGSDGTIEMKAKPNGPGGFWTCAEAPLTGPSFVFQMPKGDSLWPGDYIVGFTAKTSDQRLAYLYSELRCVPIIDAHISALPLHARMRVEARYEAADPPATVAVQAQLLDPSGKPLRQGELALTGGMTPTPLEWSLSDLPAGQHRLLVQAPALAGTRAVQYWTWPGKPAWLGSAAGKFGDDVVLKPWTPLRLLGRTPLRVGCWGREYTFGAAGLMAAVRSRQQELLAAPMSLSGTLDGRPVSFRSTTTRVTRTAPGAIEFATRDSASGLQATCEGRLEFDGFVKLRLRVSGQPGQSLDALTLDMPFRREVARLVHHFPKPSVWVGMDMKRLNARAIPPEGWASHFTYDVWIGDEEKGLQWLTESDEHWRPADPERALEIIPGAQATTLRLNLIGKPTKLDQPLEHVFAFQASPVKPMPADYRQWHYAQVGSYGIEKTSYTGPGVDRSVTYPAAGNLDPKQGTLEVTLDPKFDSLAEGELNRNLFSLHWPADTRPEPERLMAFYWNQDDRGMRVVYREGNQYTLINGSRFAWKPGETHTVAFTWGDTSAIFVDGKRLADLPAGPIFKGPADLTGAAIVVGGTNSDFLVRQIRVSDTPLPPEQMVATQPMTVTEHTLLLDRFTTITAAGGERASRPERIAGGGAGKLTIDAAEVPGGVDFSRTPYRGTVLDHYRDMGLKTIGFHEHWSDWQGFPRTSHTEELKSLLDACHTRGLKLLLYHSWQLADIAPEYPLYLRECEIVEPNRFIYTRQPPQKDYPICARSAWADFMVDGIDKLFREHHPDGIYSDGLAYPGECANALHGCGYMGEDGQRHPTLNLFAIRDVMKRVRYLMEQQGKPMLFVAHTSGSITLPTLAFADAYLDGEHMCGLPRPLRVPLDGFRAEFMGHNFGLPAYFLVYDWLAGMTTPEGMALSLLHDTEVPWSFDAMAPVWQVWQDFGAEKAQFEGYWKPRKWLQSAPPGVEVSAYVKPNGEKLVVAVNTTEAPVEGPLKLARMASARDTLGGKEVPVANAAVQLRFEPWRLNLLWVKPAAR